MNQVKFHFSRFFISGMLVITCMSFSYAQFNVSGYGFYSCGSVQFSLQKEDIITSFEFETGRRGDLRPPGGSWLTPYAKYAHLGAMFVNILRTTSIDDEYVMEMGKVVLDWGQKLSPGTGMLVKLTCSVTDTGAGFVTVPGTLYTSILGMADRPEAAMAFSINQNSFSRTPPDLFAEDFIWLYKEANETLHVSPIVYLGPMGVSKMKLDASAINEFDLRDNLSLPLYTDPKIETLDMSIVWENHIRLFEQELRRQNIYDEMIALNKEYARLQSEFNLILKEYREKEAQRVAVSQFIDMLKIAAEFNSFIKPLNLEDELEVQQSKAVKFYGDWEKALSRSTNVTRDNAVRKIDFLDKVEKKMKRNLRNRNIAPPPPRNVIFGIG